ncbi:MAG: 50S ribosomal protein L11 methyltransferase [Gammaproteobacteria bacterium]
MNWIRLCCAAEADEAWALAVELEKHGALSVSLRPDEASAALLEPEPGAAPLWDGLLVEALFAARAEAESAAAALGTEHACTLEVCADQDWIAAGRAGFAPRRYGERLWIVPDWCEPPEPAAVNVAIAPGLAFGTGTHPSTGLCLEWLAAAPLADATVIDYGTGSGILAVAAAKLGAARVFAVDTDPQALEAARANAGRNDVTVALSAPEALAVRDADVLIANILARPLVMLATEFCARVRRGGRIVLAGITDEQADSVAAAYVPEARVSRRMTRDGWTCLELLRVARD